MCTDTFLSMEFKHKCFYLAYLAGVVDIIQSAAAEGTLITRHDLTYRLRVAVLAVLVTRDMLP